MWNVNESKNLHSGLQAARVTINYISYYTGVSIKPLITQEWCKASLHQECPVCESGFSENKQEPRHQNAQPVHADNHV